MNVELREFEWDLDGYRFGGPGSPVVVLAGSGVPDGGTLRAQDVDAPRDDVIRFGRDHYTPDKIPFMFAVRGPRGGSSRPALAELRAAFQGTDVGPRTSPGVLQLLRWRLGGISWAAYGRGRWGATLDSGMTGRTYVRRSLAEAHFQLSESRIYADEARRVTLRTGAISATSGLAWPAVDPWLWGGAAVQRSGIVDVGGILPTPVRVRISGPVAGEASSIRFRAPGWELGWSRPLRAGGTLEIDTRLGMVTVDGRPDPGGLTVLSSLSGRLRPGEQELTFECVDATGTARAEVEWRDAWPPV